ncbi:hypothetical protein [Campylobacter gastrosuis]|uniref:Uncharacterized protein n=1 Tax=Campylobacter gastrosuis TaxID=2974576 RepID=A0ABT7HMC3_9BACT|nr:hypothetical protein [Campylobacter gastrosuis]MDL0087868.1 hypothetical protein [Campylobacter gastrosuis]MDL0088079.1 hypothetical protein [Campylobacter gastrosuis]
MGIKSVDEIFLVEVFIKNNTIFKSKKDTARIFKTALVNHFRRSFFKILKAKELELNGKILALNDKILALKNERKFRAKKIDFILKNLL